MRRIPPRTLLTLLALLLLASSAHAAAGWDEIYAPPRTYQALQGINYRSKPGKNTQVLGVLKTGERVTVSAMEKGWYKCTLPDGTVGYVYKRFLKHVGEASPASVPAIKTEAAAQTPAPKPAPALETKTKTVPTPKPSPTKLQEKPQQKTPKKTTETVATEPVAPKNDSTETDANATDTTEGVDCERLTFEGGGTKGILEKSVTKGGQDCYELSVGQDEWVEITLSSPENKAEFEIFSPDGSSLCAQEKHWLGRAQIAGEHILFVSQTPGSGPYKLKVKVK